MKIVIVIQILILFYIIFKVLRRCGRRNKRIDPTAPLNGYWISDSWILEIMHTGFYHVVVNDGYQSVNCEFDPETRIVYLPYGVLIWDGEHQLIDPQTQIIFDRDEYRVDAEPLGTWVTKTGTVLELSAKGSVVRGRLGDMKIVGIYNFLFSPIGVLEVRSSGPLLELVNDKNQNVQLVRI